MCIVYEKAGLFNTEVRKNIKEVIKEYQMCIFGMFSTSKQIERELQLQRYIHTQQLEYMKSLQA